MKQCCEKVSNNEIDCNVMQLLGGSMGILNSHSIKNVTMLYPNVVQKIISLHILNYISKLL